MNMTPQGQGRIKPTPKCDGQHQTQDGKEDVGAPEHRQLQSPVQQPVDHCTRREACAIQEEQQRYCRKDRSTYNLRSGASRGHGRRQGHGAD